MKTLKKIEAVDEFEYPEDLNEFQLMSQLELKPKKREAIIFTIDEHRKECQITFEYYIQNFDQNNPNMRENDKYSKKK